MKYNESLKGYTLIEILVAMSLMLMISLGGTMLFTQNLRSGGLADIDLRVNNTARAVLDELERVLRFGEVISVGDNNKTDCLNAGDNGVTGQSMLVEMLSGVETEYSLSDQRIASNSASEMETFYLTGSDLAINNLSIKWFCRSGINDKIKLEMNLSSTVLGTGVTITKTVSRDIILLNGSTN